MDVSSKHSYGDPMANCHSGHTQTQAKPVTTPTTSLRNQTINRMIINGYLQMVEDRIHLGFEPTLLTFMFNPLRGSDASKQARMIKTIERTYATHLTHVHRRPMKLPLEDLPFWLLCPDWPVPKTGAKAAIADVTANNGLHFHAVALTPPDSRLRTSLEEHFRSSAERYTPRGGDLQRLDARAIPETPEKASRYVLKSLTRQRVDPGAISVLPRSRSEL